MAQVCLHLPHGYQSRAASYAGLLIARSSGRPQATLRRGFRFPVRWRAGPRCAVVGDVTQSCRGVCQTWSIASSSGRSSSSDSATWYRLILLCDLVLETCQSDRVSSTAKLAAVQWPHPSRQVPKSSPWASEQRFRQIVPPQCYVLTALRLSVLDCRHSTLLSSRSRLPRPAPFVQSVPATRRNRPGRSCRRRRRRRH